MQENLFPDIDNENVNYAKSEQSTNFVIQCLRVLAREYSDHSEYNSYKHGLRSFVGKTRLQGFDNKTGVALFDMQSDIVEFLEFQKKDASGKPHTEDGKHYTRIRRIAKGFDYIRDFGIIRMNSAILNIYSIIEKCQYCLRKICSSVSCKTSI